MNTNKKPQVSQGKTTSRPDVRDNLDSRKNEEQEFKGDDVTHSKKETESEKPKKNSFSTLKRAFLPNPLH